MLLYNEEMHHVFKHFVQYLHRKCERATTVTVIQTEIHLVTINMPAIKLRV